MIRSPAQRKLEEWLLHKVNLQIDTKQVIVINGVTARVNGELG
jgi:hypothetical protein